MTDGVVAGSFECPACLRRVAADVVRCPSCRRVGKMRVSAKAPELKKFKPYRAPALPMRGFAHIPGSLVNAWLPSLAPVPTSSFPRAERACDDDEDQSSGVSAPHEPVLRLSHTLALPPDAVTQTFSVLAKRGSGKTYFAGVMVEEFARLRLPVVVIDPVGALWGLSKDADGNGNGIGATVLGGDHGAALDPMGGRAIAAFAAKTKTPLVLDLCHMRRDEQTFFVAEFAEELYFLKSSHRTPLHLVIDEADLFAPMRTGESDVVKKSLGAMEDLVRRGRSRGIGVTLVTQRPAVLNKNVLTQTEVLVVLRMTSPQDRDAVDEWVKMNGDEDKRRRILSSLAGLPIGEAWVWSPGWLDVFQRVKVRKRTTFDSSSTPKVLLEEEPPSTVEPEETVDFE